MQNIKTTIKITAASIETFSMEPPNGQSLIVLETSEFYGLIAKLYYISLHNINIMTMPQ